MIEMQEPETCFNLESPGGLVKVKAECFEGEVKNVLLEAMPSFVAYNNKKVNDQDFWADLWMIWIHALKA